MQNEDFILIHGPCSLESYEQMETIINELQPISEDFRCGVYKPRTSFESFQGLKDEGLEIIAELKKKYPNITITAEITDVRQLNNIDAIDVIQIGARNMQNYELLIEVGKTDKVVLLKRGFGATVDELLASADYIAKQGNENIILCERGIRTFSNTARFTLDLSAVSYLQENSNYKVIVDPSHAGGTQKEVMRLAKAAYAYGVDGLIIEVHPDPSVALSDKDQQLTIEQYKELIAEVFPLSN